MKVFVFGAGASQAAQDQVMYPPGNSGRAPLVDELFSSQYGGTLPDGLSFDIEECRTKIREVGSLEKWLSDRWNTIATLKTVRAQRAERSWFGSINLYIWNLLNKVSKTYPNAQLYSQLLKKLYDEDFGIISFNYDTLLDQSYEDTFRASLASKDAYLNGNFVKLHGSVNWFLRRRDSENALSHARHQGDESVRVRAIAENIYNGNPMSLEKLEIIEPKHSSLFSLSHVMGYFVNDGYFYPLLFMPLTGKDYSVITDFKDVMIAKAEEMMRQATDIYLIGYRANDELISELLAKAPGGTKLHVVGHGSGKTISERILAAHANLTEGIVEEQGFRIFVEGY